MQKKLTALFAFAIFVLLVGWANTPAQAHPCDRDPVPTHKHCKDNEPGPEPTGPRIAIVANNFGGGGAAAYITKALLGGSYTKLQIKNFNTWDAVMPRAEFDVLHFAYSSPPSIDASWPKLEAFMMLGGGILFEDPSNNIEDIDGLNLDVVELHVPGNDPAIVQFETGSLGTAEDVLSTFTPNLNGNSTGNFLPGNGTDCADNPFFNGTKRGLGYGCLVNNHITFMEDPGLGLVPFLRLVSNTNPGPVVGVYGMFGDGQILITGPDSGFHAGGGGGDFQTNHFCLLTNEIIWVSQVDPTVDPAKDAVENCVTHAENFLVLQQ